MQSTLQIGARYGGTPSGQHMNLETGALVHPNRRSSSYIDANLKKRPAIVAKNALRPTFMKGEL